MARVYRSIGRRRCQAALRVRTCNALQCAICGAVGCDAAYKAARLIVLPNEIVCGWFDGCEKGTTSVSGLPGGGFELFPSRSYDRAAAHSRVFFQHFARSWVNQMPVKPDTKPGRATAITP